MKTKTLISVVVSLIFCTGLLLPAFGEVMKPVKLPEPKLDTGKSLVQALKDRKTQREYKSGNLPPQVLSNLLWATWGINRTDARKRTAPSAFNRQEIEVYVTTAEGAYRYDPKGNELVQVASGDVRTLTGTQSYFKEAAINLVYVADLTKAGDAPEPEKLMISAYDTGFIAENAYLYCASEGLATVFRLGIDKQKLGAALRLKPDQRIMAAQTVGLPKK